MVVICWRLLDDVWNYLCNIALAFLLIWPLGALIKWWNQYGTNGLEWFATKRFQFLNLLFTRCIWIIQIHEMKDAKDTSFSYFFNHSSAFSNPQLFWNQLVLIEHFNALASSCIPSVQLIYTNFWSRFFGTSDCSDRKIKSCYLHLWITLWKLTLGNQVDFQHLYFNEFTVQIHTVMRSRTWI